VLWEKRAVCLAALVNVVSWNFGSTVEAQSGAPGADRLVAIVESRLPSVPAQELRLAISTALGVHLFSLGDIPIQDVDALITISIAQDQEIAILVQNMRSGKRVLSVWPLPADGDPIAQIANVIAMLLRADIAQDTSPSASPMLPFWSNPYYRGKGDMPIKEEPEMLLPFSNPYLVRVFEPGNRT